MHHLPDDAAGCHNNGAFLLDPVFVHRNPGPGISKSKAAGFNNPAGRALTGAVDLLEPADAFNIPVPRRN